MRKTTVTCSDHHTFELEEATALNKDEVLCPECGKVVPLTLSEEQFNYRPVLFDPFSDDTPT